MPQIATMFVLFGLAASSLLTPSPWLSAAMLIAGFLCVAVFDWRAARREEVPPSFARLRPVQMLVPILSLASLWPLLETGTR